MKIMIGLEVSRTRQVTEFSFPPRDIGLVTMGKRIRKYEQKDIDKVLMDFIEEQTGRPCFLLRWRNLQMELLDVMHLVRFRVAGVDTSSECFDPVLNGKIQCPFSTVPDDSQHVLHNAGTDIGCRLRDRTQSVRRRMYFDVACVVGRCSGTQGVEWRGQCQ